MPRTQVELQNFTAADNTTAETLGYSRLYDGGDGGGYLGVKSNTLGLLFSNSVRHTYRCAGTYSDDQYAKLKIATIAANTTRQLGVVVRASADTAANRDYYEWWVTGTDLGSGSRLMTLDRVSNGTVTTLDTRNIVFVAGDTLELEVAGTGTATVLTCLKNGVSQFTYADNGGSALSTGKPGFSLRGSSGAGGTDTTIDDLDTGNVSSDTIPRPLADISVTGWTSTGASIAAVIDETSPDDADYATSPVITGSGSQAIVSLTNGPLAAGYWAPRVRASVTSGTATMRVSLLNDSNAVQGSADVTVTTTITTYNPTILTTGSATRLAIEFFS